MRIAVVAPGIYPTIQDSREALHIFIKSADRIGLTTGSRHILTLYGTGRDFHHTTWKVKKIDYQLELIEALEPEFTHILYTDAADALFVGDLDEIAAKYKWYGEPDMLCCAASFLVNMHPYQAEPYLKNYEGNLPYRYPHNGGYLAKREVLVQVLERMKKMDHWDDSFIWAEAWKEGWFRPILDHMCHIFYVGDAPEIVHGRPYVAATLAQPCIIHLSGGHVERVGYKDYKLEPYAKALGII
jgi:hypothetical protein